jgi:hypothetical protein
VFIVKNSIRFQFFLFAVQYIIYSMSFNHFLKPFLFSMAKKKNTKNPHFILFYPKIFIVFAVDVVVANLFFFLSWFHFCHHLQIIEKKKQINPIQCKISIIKYYITMTFIIQHTFFKSNGIIFIGENMAEQRKKKKPITTTKGFRSI